VGQPGPIAPARTKPPRLKRILEREPAATPAHDAGVCRVRARALFLYPHRLLAWHRTVDHPPPFDVLQVSLIAGADEADRRDLAFASVVEYEPAPTLRIEILPAH